MLGANLLQQSGKPQELFHIVFEQTGLLFGIFV